MIELTRGNLLEANADALVNTVNCVGVMGKGIALQFKQAYPDNFRAYEHACREGEVQVGRMLVVPTGGLPNPRFIINFPTKRHWRGKSRLSDVELGLPALVEEVKRLGVTSVAVPPLGCGNGGLNWADVRPRIERAFLLLPGVRVLLYEPDGAPAAETMRVNTKRPPMSQGRALVIAVMARYHGVGYRLTLLEIQKLAYFLQIAGAPLRLNYEKGKFGPYAENLNHVLQAMEGHYTRGYGDRSRGAEVLLMPGAEEAASAFIEDDVATQARLESVAKLIDGFETPFGMELLATVHWVMAEAPEAAGDYDAVTARAHEWNARKRVTFSERHIRIAWQQLVDEGWLPSPKGG